MAMDSEKASVSHSDLGVKELEFQKDTEMEHEAPSRQIILLARALICGNTKLIYKPRNESMGHEWRVL